MEFDADYGAAMLTGDPDGLSMALLKLERAQGRRWEGMVMPGSRLPDPSLLRSHPRTEDRIERLNALRDALHGRRTAGEAARPPVQPARSGRFGERDSQRHWLALADRTPPPDPVLNAEERDDPAAEYALNPWERHGSRPRIRVRRGGVWW